MLLRLVLALFATGWALGGGLWLLVVEQWYSLAAQGLSSCVFKLQVIALVLSASMDLVYAGTFGAPVCQLLVCV